MHPNGARLDPGQIRTKERAMKEPSRLDILRLGSLAAAPADGASTNPIAILQTSL